MFHDVSKARTHAWKTKYHANTMDEMEIPQDTEEEMKIRIQTTIKNLEEEEAALIKQKKDLFEKIEKHKELMKNQPARYDPVLDKLFKQYEKLSDALDRISDDIAEGRSYLNDE